MRSALQWPNATLAHERWGFKRPNVLQRLGREGLALFREPRVILCLRDPVALAQRSVIADGVTLEEALCNARRQVDGAMEIAKTIDCPTLLVSFEKAKADRDGFLAELFGFCGLDVEASRYPRHPCHGRERGVRGTAKSLQRQRSASSTSRSAGR